MFDRLLMDWNRSMPVHAAVVGVVVGDERRYLLDDPRASQGEPAWAALRLGHSQ